MENKKSAMADLISEYGFGFDKIEETNQTEQTDIQKKKEEIEIEYKDGTKLSSAISISNLFEVESTILNALELEENPNNNNLTVTNKLKTTNTTMPSTGGIGTHPYRNAGILMMICSGGIYVSLRALRKKQN